MNIIVIHGRRCASTDPAAVAFALHHGIAHVVEDPELDIVPFPSADTIIITDRKRAEIYRWRDQHRPEGSGEVVRFLTWEAAMRELAAARTRLIRALSDAARKAILSPNPDLVYLGRPMLADFFERHGLGVRLYSRAYQLTPLARDLRAQFQPERKAA